jgi:hypothetical protein
MNDLNVPVIKCPWCQEKLNVDLVNVITLTTSEEVKEKLLSGEYDKFPCPVCNRDVPYVNPIVCNDVANQILIYYFPHPPPGEVRETIETLFLEAIEADAIEGIPDSLNEDWKIYVAFGRDELKDMIKSHFKEEGSQ